MFFFILIRSSGKRFRTEISFSRPDEEFARTVIFANLPWVVPSAPLTFNVEDLDRDSLRSHRMLLALALIVLAAVPYAQTLKHAFVSFDDGLYVTSNARVLQGLNFEGVGWAFTTFEGGNWHPLTWLSHMLDVSLWGGTDGWAGGHHLTNVLFHVANTLLLFLAISMMTGTAGVWRSAIVAGLFAVHPLHVESVAWVAERKDVLSTFFGFLALVYYARYVQSASWKTYLPVVVCMTLSLLAKPMLVTLPFVFLLFDFWPLRRLAADSDARLSRVFIEKVPLLLLSVVFCAIAVFSQHAGQNVASIDALPVTERLANAAVAYGTYLNRTFAPINLSVFYPYVALGPRTVLLHGLVVFVITIVAIVQWKSRPWWVVGWLFFVGTLIPVIGLVQIGLQSTADRYMYVPAVGIFLIVAWSIPASDSTLVRRVTALGVVAIMLTLTVLAHRQVARWRDNRTLFTHAASVTQFNYLAHQNLGADYERSGEFAPALAQYELAAKYRPNYSKVWVDMSNVLVQLGRQNEALERIDVAIQLDDRSSAAYNTKGVLLMIGKQFEKAEVALQRAVELDPLNMQARSNLGAAALQLGHVDVTIANLSVVAKAHPERLGVRTNLARALAGAGRRDEAISELQSILRAKPDFTAAQVALQELQR